MRELTLEEVETLLKEGIAWCRSRGRASSLAVVDFGGNLRGALRPEKGRIANILIAEKKAWTAVAFQRPTQFVRDITVPGGMAYGLQHTDPRICIVGGGYPLIESSGAILGAIGASGAPSRRIARPASLACASWASRPSSSIRWRRPKKLRPPARAKMRAASGEWLSRTIC